MTNIVHKMQVQNDGTVKTRASYTKGIDLPGHIYVVYSRGDSEWSVALNGNRLARFATCANAESFVSGMKKGMIRG